MPPNTYMAYARVQQANEPLDHDIAPSPPRPIPRTLHDHVQENLRVCVHRPHPDTLLITSAISLRPHLEPACCRQ
jgi:hypothetical protein